MTTYIIFSFITFICFALILVYFFSLIRKFKERLPKNDEQVISTKQTLNWKVYFALIATGVIVIFGCFAPFVLTRKPINEDFNFRETGQVGDTIGGLMNPFVALAGVIVTGLAFYIQYKANQQQRELFEKEQRDNKEDLQKQIDSQRHQLDLQQFESQFYEMLRLHRENVTEMKIEGYDFSEVGTNLEVFEKITEGRKIFVTMQTELEVILHIYKTVNGKLEKSGFEKCYQLFFAGIDRYEIKYLSETAFINKIKYARKKHMQPYEFEMVHTNKERKEFDSTTSLNFNYKPFSGHASRLGHYFRHLFLLVKSVATSEVEKDYDKRMKFLKILRAQLSNHEQTLLFYNWLSGYGERWENKEYQFFTEYCMIHNLWHDMLFNDPFISEQVTMLRKKETYLRKGGMFEIDE